MKGTHRAWLGVAAVSFMAFAAHAEPRIRSLGGVIVGHRVGGVAIDLVGNIYVADFGDVVWKVSPEGERQIFATGLYGTSGNAIDRDGALLQSSCYSNSITRIDRNGQARSLATTGLSCPVGIAVSKVSGDIFVANCSSNSIARIASDGTVAPFAQSSLLRCPNGLALDARGNLYVTNFRDNRILKVDPGGSVALFATASTKGLGHLCFKEDRLFVTAHDAHELYEVAMDGAARRILGHGKRGRVDGPDARALLSFPNGIACDPWAPRLYINEYLNDSDAALPRRMMIRVIELEPTPPS